MEKICKNCKWWDKHDHVPSYAKYRVAYGTCDNENFIESSDPENTASLQYWDFEGYSAGFEVGQNFGCIHFKEKG